jgi:hypothetical protein
MREASVRAKIVTPSTAFDMSAQLWDVDAVPPPDKRIIANDASCFGFFGVTLAETLEELQKTETTTVSGSLIENADDESRITADEPKLSFEMIPGVSQEIMKSLGRAMAKCHSGSSFVKNAPAAILRGRVDHYNRRNTKWRIFVRDAQIQRREPLERNRRMRERPSLWDVSKDNESTNESPTKLDLELLAYDDIE